MTIIEFFDSFESSFFTLTDDVYDSFLLSAFPQKLDTVPKTVRYRQHPRVGPSNLQQPVTRHHQSFTGHRFRVGRSKK